MNFIDFNDANEALRDHGVIVTSVDVRNPCDPISKITIEGLLYADSKGKHVADRTHESLVPEHIFKNGLYTTVMWSDGTKTIVKRGEDEPDDEYNAFTAALAKKLYGSTSAVKRIAEMTKVQSKKYKEPVESEPLIERMKEEVQRTADALKQFSTTDVKSDMKDLARKQWEEYLAKEDKK